MGHLNIIPTYVLGPYITRCLSAKFFHSFPKIFTATKLGIKIPVSFYFCPGIIHVQEKSVWSRLVYLQSNQENDIKSVQCDWRFLDFDVSYSSQKSEGNAVLLVVSSLHSLTDPLETTGKK